jgi:hypothetical protein
MPSLSMYFTTGGNSKLGFLSLDILVTENLSLPSEATKYPVEDGSQEISDHITQNNEELSITGRIASSQILSFEFGPACHTKMVDAIDQLRSMHKARQPVKVITGLGVYEDMAFTSLSVTRGNGDDGGNWLDISADLRKIRKVAIKTTNLPEDKATGSASGQTGTTGKPNGKPGSSETPPVNTNGPTVQLYETMKPALGLPPLPSKPLIGPSFGPPVPPAFGPPR